jgi:hypothetical protein
MPRRIPLLLLAGLLPLVACSRSPSPAYIARAAPRPPVPGPPAPIAFAGKGFDLHTAGLHTNGTVGQAEFDGAWAGVLATLNHYLDEGVVRPLRTGGPAGDLQPLFSGPAAARVVPGGPDRFAFIDENLPPVDDLRQETAVATLTGLAGTDGVMSVVTAGVDLRLAGNVAGAPVTVVRTGEVVLMPEGGVWRIDAYDIQVTRTRAQDRTTTAAHA